MKEYITIPVQPYTRPFANEQEFKIRFGEAKWGQTYTNYAQLKDHLTKKEFDEFDALTKRINEINHEKSTIGTKIAKNEATDVDLTRIVELQEEAKTLHPNLWIEEFNKVKDKYERSVSLAVELRRAYIETYQPAGRKICIIQGNTLDHESRYHLLPAMMKADDGIIVSTNEPCDDAMLLSFEVCDKDSGRSDQVMRHAELNQNGYGFIFCSVYAAGRHCSTDWQMKTARESNNIFIIGTGQMEMSIYARPHERMNVKEKKVVEENLVPEPAAAETAAVDSSSTSVNNQEE